MEGNLFRSVVISNVISVSQGKDGNKKMTVLLTICILLHLC